MVVCSENSFENLEAMNESSFPTSQMCTLTSTDIHHNSSKW